MDPLTDRYEVWSLPLIRITPVVDSSLLTAHARKVIHVGSESSSDVESGFFQKSQIFSES